MSYRVEFEQWVPVPIARVFLFFADPRNLPPIMPPSTATRILSLNLVPPPAAAVGTSLAHLAGVGSEVVTSFRLVPSLRFRVGWTALIVEFEWDHHFADVQKAGPFKRFHHRHEFIAEARSGVEGTIVRDVVELETGWGPLGWLADKIFVPRQLRRTFEYRQQALPNLLR